jgi:hypothetical protein
VLIPRVFWSGYIRNLGLRPVVSTIPKSADSNLLRHTLEHIRRGAADVARPRALRVVLMLHELVIHDVDCKPYRYQKATVESLTKCLGEAT